MLWLSVVPAVVLMPVPSLAAVGQPFACLVKPCCLLVSLQAASAFPCHELSCTQCNAIVLVSPHARSHWLEAGLSGDDLDARMGILVVPDVAAGTALNQDAEKVDKQGYLLNKLQYAITAVLERAKAAALVKRYGCSLPRATRNRTMDIRVEAVVQEDRLSYQFLVAPPSNPEREVGAFVWAEMCAGYFGVASPAVRRESGVLGLRVYVRPDGGEVRIGKYGWQALGEGGQNKDGVRTRYHNTLVRTVCASLRQAGTGCRECKKGFFRRIGLVKARAVGFDPERSAQGHEDQFLEFRKRELTPDLLVDPGVLQAAGVSRAVGPVSVPRLLDLKTIAWSEAMAETSTFERSAWV